MVEVFRTNVADPADSQRIVLALHAHFPFGSVNFDLEDCDRILRIEDEQVSPETTIRLLEELGYFCEVLEG